ncbi:AAA family ATPase [Ottowia sp. VDI28]|uniref:AAA family ATPase n=1 Tax=Ottowia sp. VDI28 TaxID=3133968 RepID=UPI003C2B762A
MAAAEEYADVSRYEVKPAPANDGVILVCGSTLTPQPIAWLWRHWLAQGKLHILAGAPGQGKTTIAITMAATVTIGGRWPDGSRCEAGNVLIWSGEDDPADTLLPRLIAAGADRERVFFVDSARVNGEIVPFDPARDMVQLMAAINQIGGVTLLIVDPVVSAVAGDSHKNTEVRRALQPLVDLAAATGAAVLGISHFSKGGQGQDPTQRVVGSVAFSAVARVVLVAAKVKSMEGEDRRILARSKSNIGPDDGGFEYGLEQVEALPGIQASRVAWGKVVEGTARDLLAEPEDDEAATDASDACELLRAELVAEAWTPANSACKPLRDAGFSKKQIWSASKRLNVVRRRGGFQGAWYWRMPGGIDPDLDEPGANDSLNDSNDSTFLNVESMESMEPLESLGVVKSGREDTDLDPSGGTIEEF